jgi:phage replication-related protein YjqB (UPF0714/DUF867 family)
VKCCPTIGSRRRGTARLTLCVRPIQPGSDLADKYRNFSALAARKREGTRFRVVMKDRDSDFLIAAPHGGRAEPHTSSIAKAIAGTHHSVYVLEALVGRLHITSSHFDEPCAVALARRHSKVLTVHGCQNDRSPTIDVFVGGLDRALRDAVIEQLQNKGFTAAIDTRTTGRSQANLCNKSHSRAGVQLEITRRLRNRLCDQQMGLKSVQLRAFARAIRQALRKSETS